MLNASSLFKDKLKKGNYKKLFKIELLTKDETLIEDISQFVIDGSISVDKNRDIRRNLSLTLNNINNRFTPSPSTSSRIWLDKKLRVYIGMTLPTGIEWIPQGVFLLSKPVASTKVGQNPTVRLDCVDKMAKWGKLINNLTISAGVSVPTAIQLVLSGIETKFLFDNCAETVPYELTYNSGTDRKQIVKELVDMIVWDCFYDVYGQLRLKQFPSEPENGVVTWTYQKEDYSMYVGSEKEIDDSDLFNICLAIGSSSKSATVSAISRDDDILSPFSTQNIGERLYIHNNGSPDPLITTEALAISRSSYDLRKHLQYAERQRIEIIPNFLHEEGDVVEIIDNDTLTNDKYELLSFSIPLNIGGMMSGEAWRVRRLM